MLGPPLATKPQLGAGPWLFLVMLIHTVGESYWFGGGSRFLQSCVVEAEQWEQFPVLPIFAFRCPSFSPEVPFSDCSDHYWVCVFGTKNLVDLMVGSWFNLLPLKESIF